ncbi:hypothetical protein QKU48_gp0935 [Fadolivirus algeromassiliense]|jgi:hypothetical protein|uniref:Uncharacterized protein n=1 Tax=Fadolivirus FV1/VV64 TaxID=3070911 RepID=A0A7D3UR73_9VIRU|nr:hypothetical protein QKU48_gp0935 [Fadolivirus algeromassiliense]QKF94393.1 hypothetical protein Fadolivirus_1_935 [Fadolivirus FV1/VV64]
MDLVLACFSGVASFGYMTHNVKRFLEFQKFQNTGYVDDYHLLDGKITSQNSLPSFINEYKKHPTNNAIINNLCVEIGKEKTGINHYPIRIGNNTVLMPQPYQYTDWKTTHNKTNLVTDIFLNNRFKLLFQDIFTPFYIHHNSIKESHGSKLMQLFNMFDKYSIEFKYGDKVKVIENSIHDGDHVSVFGKYVSNKEVVVSYIGSKEEVLNAVRKNVCKVNYGMISFAGLVLVGSVSYIISNYDDIRTGKIKNRF